MGSYSKPIRVAVVTVVCGGGDNTHSTSKPIEYSIIVIVAALPESGPLQIVAVARIAGASSLLIPLSYVVPVAEAEYNG